MYGAFRCVMNNIQDASLFQRTAFILITCWSTKKSLAVLPTLFARKFVRTPVLIFYKSNICFPILRPFPLDWMERICSFLNENDGKAPKAGCRSRFSRSVFAQCCWSHPWLDRMVKHQCCSTRLVYTVPCRWMLQVNGFSWEDVQHASLNSWQILPVWSNCKYLGIIV